MKLVVIVTTLFILVVLLLFDEIVAEFVLLRNQILLGVEDAKTVDAKGNVTMRTAIDFFLILYGSCPRMQSTLWAIGTKYFCGVMFLEAIQSISKRTSFVAQRLVGEVRGLVLFRFG
jgi:hypothetical protein